MFRRLSLEFVRSGAGKCTASCGMSKNNRENVGKLRGRNANAGRGAGKFPEKQRLFRDRTNGDRHHPAGRRETKSALNV
jgi:hypothetical protein